MELDPLIVGPSLKRRKSESDDRFQKDASENAAKKQKQENIYTCNSMRDNCFLAATESAVENENADEPENGTETELTAENENTEEIKNGTETELIKENKNMEEVENNAKTEIITENGYTEKDENGTESKNIAGNNRAEKAENRTESENIAENGNAEKFENDVETELIADIRNNEVGNGAETAVIVENEYMEEAEICTVTENIAENKNTQEVENGTVTENIAENRNTEEVENGTVTENIAENKNTEEVENGTVTEIIAENKNTEEVENGTLTENIAENKNTEEVENGTVTENIAENRNTEEFENGTVTENIAENRNTEEVENCIETDLIAENNNADEAENDAQIDNCAQEKGSEIANSTEEYYKVQVPRGINKETSVTEDDFIECEGRMDNNASSGFRRSHEYHHETTNTWLSVHIKRYAGAEPIGSSNERTIDVYNTDSKVNEDVIKTKFSPFLRHKELFYHGTTRESAKSILEEGINLEKTNRILDFSQGKGFYVTDNYNKAFEWCEKKGRMNRTYSKGAIIVFAIDTGMRREERHLSLMVDTITNRKFWECIVGHFRRGKKSPDVTRVLRDVKYIEGPVAKIRRRQASSEIHTPHEGGQFYQLCICDQGFARKFGSLTNIVCVIFLTD